MYNNPQIRTLPNKIYDSIPIWRKKNYFGKQFVLCHNGKIILSDWLLHTICLCNFSVE